MAASGKVLFQEAAPLRGSLLRQKAPAPAPAPAPKGASAPAPAPAPNSGTGLGAAVADGFGWGFGNSIAHRVGDFIWGPRVVKHETVESEAPAATAQSNSMDSFAGSDACYASTKSFKDCLNNNTSDIGRCQFYMDMISECRKNTGSVDRAGPEHRPKVRWPRAQGQRGPNI